jgi:hypothetical protein
MKGSTHKGKAFKVVSRYLDCKGVLLERDSIAPLNLIKRVDGIDVSFD